MTNRPARRSPEACSSMEELRIEIDKIDSELVGLIAERARFIDRAIALKKRDGLPAYIPQRVEEVVANVRKTARDLGAPEHVVETVWRVMVDEFIAIESGRLAGPSAVLDTPQR
ncbi:MAG: chorismate mutase [Hyphomicrobiales bacterium]